MEVLYKFIRFLGWTLFFVSLIFFICMIAMFFTVEDSDKWTAIPPAIISGLLTFAGWKMRKFKKKKPAVKTATIPHWEEKNKDDEEKVEYHIEIPKDDKIDVEARHPIQVTKKESIQDMVRAALDIRSEVQSGKRTVEIIRKYDHPYEPLLQLCDEIENDTENNYIPFDPPISVEIKYCDRDGEITNRKIDILYIAASDYNDGYYIKAFCHLRNENRTFNIERIQKTTANGSSVDIIQYIVDFYRNTAKYKETVLSIKTRDRINSNDIIGCTAKVLTYISRIDGIFTRKEKTLIANYIKELDNNQSDIEIEDYVAELAYLNPSTIEYKKIVKSMDISENLIAKATEITGKDPLRQGAFEILFKQYEKNKAK